MNALQRIILSNELTKLAVQLKDESLDQNERIGKQNRANEIIVLLGGDADNNKFKSNGVIKGRNNNVKTAKNTKVSTVFALLEIDQVIASHSATGAENPLYPQELQPRDRSRESSQAWVQKTSNTLDPESLGRSGRADTGAPIIGDDFVVESGNGRTMAIQLAYERGQAEDYRSWLIEEADYFGFTAEQVESFKQPILVRIRTSEVDRVKFTVEANQDDKLSFSATERAKSDAKRLDENLLSLFVPGADGDLLTSSNQKFILGFLKSLGETEAAQYMTTEGKPTQALVARMKAALFSKAYNDDRLLEMMADQTKPELQNMLNALGVAAPKFIEAQAFSRGDVQDVSSSIVDSIEQTLDKRVANAIIDATNTILSAKKNDQDIVEFVKQQGLFGDLGEGVPELAVFMSKNARSAKKMALLFKSMAEFTEKHAIDSQNIGLFGDPEPVTITDAFNYAVAIISEHYDAKTADMFDSLDSNKSVVKNPITRVLLSKELIEKMNILSKIDPQDDEYTLTKKRIDQIIALLNGKVLTQEQIDNYKFLTGEPVASISSGQIQPDENGRTIKNAIQWFKDWLSENNHGEEFNNEQLGTVIIAPSGIKSAMSHKPKNLDIQGLPALPLMIEKARVLSRTMDDEGKPLENIVVAAPINIDDKKCYMVVRLRRHTEDKTAKPRFYTQAISIETDIKKGNIPSDQVTGQNTLLTQNGGRSRLLNVLHEALNVNIDEYSNMLDSLRNLTGIDEKAHNAATSPLNDDPEPTEKQKIENDYKTGDFKLLGLNICIENPEGSIRAGIDENGNGWTNKLTAHYGYIDGTIGLDGDEIDCFVKPGTDEQFDGNIYVIDQMNDEGELDEHKVIIGAKSRAEAKSIYLSNYSDDWQGFGKIRSYAIDDFKALLESNLMEPAAA